MRRRVGGQQREAYQAALPVQGGGGQLGKIARLLLLGGLIIWLILKITMSSSPESAPRLVVVGGGLAGMSAAFAAVKAGAFVTLVEKDLLGGNSAKATSGANAVGSSVQRQHAAIEDTVPLFMRDIQKSGHEKCDPSLVHILAAQSGAAIDALSTEHDLVLSDIEQLGGHSAKRTHRFPPKDGRAVPVGWTIISKLKADLAKLVEQKKVEIFEHTALVDWAQTKLSDGSEIVSSVTLQDMKSNQTRQMEDVAGLILTAGGYAADSSPESLLAKHRPDLIGFPTTNGPFARGETVQMGIKHGLKVTDIEAVQLHPTGFVHPDNPTDSRKFLCPEVIRGVGAILVDTRGHRFVNELMPRDKVSEAILSHGGNSKDWQLQGSTPGSGTQDRQHIALLVMSQKMAERFGSAAFGFYKSKGFFFEISDPQQLRDRVPSVDFDTLRNTIATYDLASQGKIDDPFQKTVFPESFGDLSHTTLYGAFVTPSLHFSMGGLAIGPDGRAISAVTNAPIANLFVAGENAGGVHGANRLGGNGCLESMVFGRLVGRLSARLPHQQSIRARGIDTFGDTELTSEVLMVEPRPADERTVLRLALAHPLQRWDLTKSLKSLKVTTNEQSAVTFSQQELSVATRTALPGILDISVAGTHPNIHPGDSYTLSV